MGARQSRKSFGTGIKWLVGSGALTLFGLGTTVLVLRPDRPEPVPVRLIAAERDTVEVTINESGTVELGGQQTLTAPTEGAVDRVLVQPGDRVEQGQVLLTLRNPDRQTALSDQQLKISQQEVELLRSRQKVAEAQEQLGVDRQTLERLSALAADGAIARTEVQEVEDQVRSTIAAQRTAEAEARTAALDLDILRLELRRIEQELRDTVITAPISGRVLGVSIKDGDGVEIRTNLLTLGNPAQELVQLQLSTLNAAQVSLNQIARVSVIGADPRVFTGRVRQIYPQAIAATAQQGASDPSGQVTVPTTVQLDQPTQQLIPGAQVNVEIVLEQRQDVVTLSIEAVQQAESQPFVWVLDPKTPQGDRVAQRPISLGLEGLTQVEVRAGLRPGEQVVLPPPDRELAPGTLVDPQTDPQTETGPASP